jgi:hypothetical protein
MLQCSTIGSSHGDFVEGVFQCTCLVMVHAHGVPKQKPLGLKRNGGQSEETAEAEKELYEDTRSGNGRGLHGPA